MPSSLVDVRTYYDARVERQLRDFVNGNRRVERAWMAVEHFAPLAPRRILEVGCGIGAISWRMTRCWPSAEVVGLDVSPEQLRVAEILFASSRLRFVEGPLVSGLIPGPLDLVVLLDVYEHIDPRDRSTLQSTLEGLLSDDARVVITTPTPRHLRWLRKNHPDEIQPIDEDITVETLLEFASSTGTDLCYYKEIGVWHEGDYLHSVMRKKTRWVPVVGAPRSRTRLARWLGKLPRMFPLRWLLKLPRVRHDSAIPSKSERAALVRERLGDRALAGM
jgi:SAM-dependent methyltransferase